MDSVGPQAVGKNKLQVLATKSGSKEKKTKPNKKPQNSLKRPKTTPNQYSSFGPRHEHVDLEPEMAPVFIPLWMPGTALLWS